MSLWLRQTRCLTQGASLSVVRWPPRSHAQRFRLWSLASLDSLSTKRKLQCKRKQNVTEIQQMTDEGVTISSLWIGFVCWVTFCMSSHCKLRLVLFTLCCHHRGQQNPLLIRCKWHLCIDLIRRGLDANKRSCLKISHQSDFSETAAVWFSRFSSFEKTEHGPFLCLILTSKTCKLTRPDADAGSCFVLRCDWPVKRASSCHAQQCWALIGRKRSEPQKVIVLWQFSRVSPDFFNSLSPFVYVEVFAGTAKLLTEVENELPVWVSRTPSAPC